MNVNQFYTIFAWILKFIYSMLAGKGVFALGVAAEKLAISQLVPINKCALSSTLFTQDLSSAFKNMAV